jgi:hypothetical protein
VEPAGLPTFSFSESYENDQGLSRKVVQPPSGSTRQRGYSTAEPDVRSPANAKEKRPFGPNPRLSAVVEHWCRKLHDDDPERTVRTLHHLWWNTHCPLERFLRVLDTTGNITQPQISKSQVRLTRQDTRAAMPYFIRVVQTLVEGPDDTIDGVLANVITG